MTKANVGRKELKLVMSRLFKALVSPQNRPTIFCILAFAPLVLIVYYQPVWSFTVISPAYGFILLTIKRGSLFAHHEASSIQKAIGITILFDVFALTSIGEPFGLVVVEAMACGKPVVVSSSGALPEVVGDAGLLFEPRNPKELAEKIIWLLSNQSAMEELGLKGYDRVASMFRWDVATRKYFE